MKIFVDQEGRLGNNLLQYFFARILAEKINSVVYIKFEFPPELGIECDTFTTTPLNSSILTEKWEGSKVSLEFNSKKIEEDLDEIADEILKSNCENLILRGYFQQYHYYMKERDFIRKYFIHDFSIKEKTLGIHVRKGDIINGTNDLPDEWFFQMIKKYPDHKKYITTDTPESSIVSRLLEIGCELYQNSPGETILEFSTFSDLILSQGTFSWWMAFLSNSEKNFLIPETGWNSEHSSTKILPEEKKWNYYKFNSGELIRI
jgi:hypothetical protein